MRHERETAELTAEFIQDSEIAQTVIRFLRSARPRHAQPVDQLRGRPDQLDLAKWGSRPFKERFAENTMRLVSPLL